MAGGPQFVQGVSGVTNIENGSGDVATTAAFSTQNTAAGNMLCALVNINGNTITLNSVSDNQGGNTWNILPVVTPGSSYRTYFCYAFNITGGTKPTVSFTFSATQIDVWYCLGEYSGANNYRGTSTFTTGTGPTLTTSAVTSVVNDLLIGYIASNQNLSALTGTSPFTLRETGGNGTIFLNGFEDDIASGVSSTCSFSKTNGDTSGAAILAFYGSYSIAGSTGVAGTNVAYVGTNLGVSGSVTSTTGGAFSITGLPADTYTLTPTQTGYTFAPTTRTPTITSANLSGQNFTPTQLTVATPTFSPVAGTYTGTQTVTVSDTNSGLAGFAMYYTLDGSTPTTGSTLYTVPISVTSSLTLKVLAMATGYANSTVGSAAYVINSSGGGIGTVLTSGAATPTTVANSSGFSWPITSPTTSGKVGQPTPIVFCDPNGNEYTVTGSTRGGQIAGATPVCLCTAQGLPITPTIQFTSNSNSINITATKTGVNLGRPTPVVLTDLNGFAYVLTAFSTFGSFMGNPKPITLTDVNGNVLTLLVAA